MDMTDAAVAAEPSDEHLRRAVERVEELEAKEARLGELQELIDQGFLEGSTLMLAAEFHGAFGVPLRQEPGIPPHDRAQLRLDLMTEELNELVAAIAADDIVAAADALADLQVALDGTFLEFGLGAVKADLVAAVHRANMSKLGADGQPVLRGDGKILKGPGYVPPELGPIVAAARGEISTAT